ncbi:cytochrome P450 4d8 [Lucilia sericata]|uniref:cytochrome P450 4d8 n=1 Tax=Lucilia sericata TaxID=13632 RepID=UPI0018A87C94|nr:cytochrome P450 4d8 [Lucilia sericata]
MDLLIFFAIILFLIGLIIHISQKPMRDAVSNIPGPYNFPILGAFYLIFKLEPKSVFKTANEYRLKYGQIMKIWAFNRLIVISGDAEINEQLLSSTTHISKQRSYGILHQWLGVGLLMSDGRKWHSRRKIITPTFHFKILQQFVEVFDQQAGVLVQCLAKNLDGKKAFDVYPYICAATLDIIAETAMGTKINAQTDSTMQYTSAVNEMTKLMAWRFMRLPLNNEVIFTILHPFKKLRQTKLIQILHKFTANIIEERRLTLKKSLQDSAQHKESDQEIGSKQRMALLDVLLQSTIDGKPLSDEDIREEVDTFMFEGHDTTASAISFTLYLLARYPQVQNKVVAEIHKVFGENSTKSITLQDLNEMKYMECVIKESLRLYPPIPIIGRQIMEDFKCKHSRLGDVVLPAGTEFFITIFGMLKIKTGSKLCEDFVPERHLSTKPSDDFTFIPFSAGPRNCIGQKFAMLEMKVLLAKILKEYQLLPLGEDVAPELNIVMRSTTGLQIGIKKRTSRRECFC